MALRFELDFSQEVKSGFEQITDLFEDLLQFTIFTNSLHCLVRTLRNTQLSNYEKRRKYNHSSSFIIILQMQWRILVRVEFSILPISFVYQAVFFSTYVEYQQ